MGAKQLRIMQIINYTYRKETLPKSWGCYFDQSIEGKTYKCLVNDDDELVMSE